MKVINGIIHFEVTFNAIDVLVNDDFATDPDDLFEAVIDNWCKGYSEQLGAYFDEYQSDYREQDLSCECCTLEKCDGCALNNEED